MPKRYVLQCLLSELAYQVVSVRFILPFGLDMQAGQAAAAGYFGGYTAKMQEMGKKELEHMEATILRKIDTEPSMIEKQKWHLYSKRLLKDLEAKGTIRTAVEGWNLSLHAAAHTCKRKHAQEPGQTHICIHICTQKAGRAPRPF